MASQGNALRLGPPAHKTARFTRAGESLGLSVNTIPDLIREVMRGFSYGALTAFETNSGVSVQSLAETIGIPERTLARRRAAGPAGARRIRAALTSLFDLRESRWIIRRRCLLRSPMACHTKANAREPDPFAIYANRNRGAGSRKSDRSS